MFGLGFSVCSFCPVAHPVKPKAIAAKDEIRTMFFMSCKTKDDSLTLLLARSVHLQARVQPECVSIALPNGKPGLIIPVCRCELGRCSLARHRWHRPVRAG